MGFENKTGLQLRSLIKKSGELELSLVKVAIPEPAADEVVVRVEANTDFTGTMPIQRGSRVAVKGEYEFDPRGGVIHWTHRDPRGRHESGYVQLGGQYSQ